MLKAIRLDKSRKRMERVESWNRINDKLQEWVAENKQRGVELKVKGGAVLIELVEFDDGQWAYGMDIELQNQGLGCGIHGTNDLYGSREHAIKVAMTDAMQYCLRIIARGDASQTLESQVKKLLPQALDVLLSPSTASAEQQLAIF